MTTISAQTILRSRHSQRPDKVLSTLLLRYPRWIHAELMTHRQLSRNAASSRAIPVAKLIADVESDPAVPMHWGANQKGMQANAETDTKVSNWAFAGMGPKLANDRAWLQAKNTAVAAAKSFAKAGYHKQIVNRLLEPFAHITVLASATEWSNFIALRDHSAAEPHIQILAREIKRELDRTDNINHLLPGMWHLPFRTEEWGNQRLNGDEYEIALKREIARSVACCASTSYKTVDGFDMTYDRAIDLHDKLVGSTPLHASPAEHVAQADRWDPGSWGKEAIKDELGWENPEQHKNFVGFRQYRAMLPNECL
ncbi:FAD-dependent thymidylate synthase [Mesorhizobium sp. M4B.F.Ca.ET.058.02.1.1]|uniref:FAD-dependent thymidylate synthase n=1 Tax=Mesorhizobium sp. M4B.F.Ca.ET.058.02.1.1 TaxID=2493675 RepID=UPI000F7518D3|nr:FAD-dependent thymidylate synthase [Mesorhizobium sp. M4B.F.Ca.ET.058.02.1.1]AZO48024.1 thymidylate synthase [Mesorhizobium sp. M4B.F.Ca.ET.058.02.1.1]